MKLVKKISWLLLLAVLVYGIRYAWVSFPIISGYTAKNMCSCVFLAQRNSASVAAEELGSFPLKLGSYSINYTDSSVTGKVWGFAKRKAIYRAGLGCTLVNELPESEIRNQPAPVLKSMTDSLTNKEWPAGNKIASFIPPNVDVAKLNKLLQQEVNKINEKHQQETRALLLVYNGQLIAEKYAVGFSAQSKMLGWSMAKSVTAALVGLLVKDGKLDVNANAPVAEWANIKDDRQNITLKNLLQQTSGLNFEENYSKHSEATQMLFNKADMGAYTAGRKLREKPGTRFYYSSGNSNILSRIVRQTVGDKNYHSFLYDSLFYKLGMYHTVMEPDASGTMVGSSYMYATAQDWARFGLLYYNNGMVNGEKVFTDDWVAQSVAPINADNLQQYGFQFWLNGKDANNPERRRFPAAPADMFFADGYAGQNVFIIPSKKLVIVRLGFKNYNENDLLAKLLACIK